VSTDADHIREEIQRTRDNLSADVDALAYKASPSRMVHGRTDQIRGAVRSAKDKVMGVASDAGDQTSSAASVVSDTTTSAAGKVKHAAEGNPLAAGLVVFGAAWLISSLIPRSNTEHQAAQAVRTAVQEHAGPVTEALADAGHGLQENLREPVRAAADSVKGSVVDAAHAVKDDTKTAAQEVRSDAAGAGTEITR
jgi:hypothetical protein